jgi:hypothetical protein
MREPGHSWSPVGRGGDFQFLGLTRPSISNLQTRSHRANLRRHGKHDLADHYERALADAPPLQPIDNLGGTLREALARSERVFSPA